MDYQVGCNYWASHAGTEMWVRWDESIVEKDFRAMRDTCGVRCVRMFPNWRDFQPIHAYRCAGGAVREVLFSDDRPLPNAYGIDPEQLAHFHAVCRIASRTGIRLIVGIVTGWMSGRLFVPPALEGKNAICDPECLLWEERFVRGFVEEMRDEQSILAWDLGNESNNMADCATPEQASVWTMTIANAIRLADPTREIISGMHALTPDGIWNFRQQGEFTDILTPHPYPSIFSKRDIDPLNQLATTMYPTAQSLYYAGLSGRQSMIEETGTFNKMLGEDAKAADFIRTSLFSGWANESAGTLWWCAFDQEQLDFPPYNWHMCENELGLMRSDFSRKEPGRAMAAFTAMRETLPFTRLPPRETNAVCVLTRSQTPLLVQYGATVLCKQAGIEPVFRYHDQPLPDAPLYLLPSVNGHDALTVRAYRALLDKARAGATLYVSLDAGLLLDFENVFGLTVQARQNRRGVCRATIQTPVGDVAFAIADGMELHMTPTTAEVLARDADGNPLLTRNPYGKGQVYLLVAPLEKALATLPGAFCDAGQPAWHGIYRVFSETLRAQKTVVSEEKDVVATVHMQDADHAVVFAINYAGTDKPLRLTVQPGWTLHQVYGAPDAAEGCVGHNDGAIFMASR